MDNASLKSGLCHTVERIHQLLRYTLISSSVAWCVWSSVAILSISRITSSVRPNSIMVLRNLASWIKKCSVVFLITFFLPVAVTVGSTFPDAADENRKEVKSQLDAPLALTRIISQEVTVRAVDDADVQIRQTYTLCCVLGSVLSNLHSSVSPAASITFRDSLLKKIELSMLLKFTLKCLSLRVVLDFLNQISNVDAM